ncbi:MAG TPA: ParB/RepB/Spo0J family partition protein [Chloroflexota bacterium]
MPKEHGLGRGLGALIPGGLSGGRGLVEIDLDAVSPNPKQPRTVMDEAALAELADSIRQHGILQPLIVTRSGSGYTLVAGERRWRAARLAGLSTVPALVKDTSPSQLLEVALVENIQRQDLGPLEEAAAYKQLIEDLGLTQEEAARRVGKSRSAVANSLRLLNLLPEAKEALEQGLITGGHARTLLSLATPEEQRKLLKAMLSTHFTVRAAEESARRSAPRQQARAAQDAETAALEERFRERLSTKVELHRGRRGGRLVIHFYSDDELDSIYRAIAGE